MTARDILVAARAMIADPTHFTLAARSVNPAVHTIDSVVWAVPWTERERPVVQEAYQRVLAELRRRGFDSLVEWGRGGSHQLALEIYDAASGSRA
jgi:hypothetical protein